MPYATTKDNVKLYYEAAGSGTPIIFSHEFAGDYRNWELQMRFFSRRHRCITYSARGYKPSDVPKDWKDYSYKHWSSDAMAVLLSERQPLTLAASIVGWAGGWILGYAITAGQAFGTRLDFVPRPGNIKRVAVASLSQIH